ncbi:MAG TPA: DNA polymerase IV [Jiangellaceae bacterium]|nr:DNA polymerase IV [Jiangellaceae bacterium]
MRVRTEPSVLHLDLDAFYAAVEQRDKPSLRGRPVVVGGLGPRGVVSTASYEARRYGIRSAMPMAEARRRCPHAAFVAGRFRVYHAASAVVMAALRDLSPLVEPLSMDEAFVDLAAGPSADLSSAGVWAIGVGLRRDIRKLTRLTASVGAATSKLMAKIASEHAKPDGLAVVEPGTELDVLRPLPVRSLWGVGPATAARLSRLGVRTVGDLERISESELVDLLGEAHGRALYRLARADDTRPVVAERESKSISVEDTFDRDVADPALLSALVERLSARVATRLAASGLSGRTVTLKVRLHDFTTMSRSATLPAPTDDAKVVSRLAARLLTEVDTTGGIRLLGVGISGLADWVQRDLFTSADAMPSANQPEPVQHVTDPLRWVAGMDVVHTSNGPGWVWGSGRGRVTVRFETADTAPGPVRTFPDDDPDLMPAFFSGSSQPPRAH